MNRTLRKVANCPRKLPVRAKKVICWFLFKLADMASASHQDVCLMVSPLWLMKADMPVLAERAMLRLVSMALSLAYSLCWRYPGVSRHHPSFVMMNTREAPSRMNCAMYSP